MLRRLETTILAENDHQQVITFNTDNPRILPVLSRGYLELHAACAKVAHLSAAADYMDSVIRDKEGHWYCLATVLLLRL